MYFSKLYRLDGAIPNEFALPVMAWAESLKLYSASESSHSEGGERVGCCQ